ncbi:MAG TPA: DNA polymerase/3'-5' exonuclease PolX [Parvularculaceae bacterium]|nr:DNA polymerase/3'-5' exonuclease PolX [Amphiplicatus sp.]HPE31926.1 DNA polymerase/3'-5' exonuclease PolX [Parvularculaceae bacterium]
MHNDEIAQIFDQLADLLEIDEANPFRVRAYRDAARMLRGLSEEVSDMLERGEDLADLPTIGKDLAGKIQEIVDTGRLQVLEDMKRTVPPGLAELTKLPGFGPKRVKRVYDELGIRTVEAMRKAAEQGELQKLPGFGAKTEAKILSYFQSDRSSDMRTRLFDAEKIAERIVRHLTAIAKPADICVAGSYRRQRETVGDLDVLVASNRTREVMDHFVAFDEVSKVDSKGSTRATVHLRSGMQVDCRVVEKASFGAALVYFTGSKAHNISLRKRGVARGLKINEYGAFKGAKTVAGRTEKEIYAAVGLPFVPPELREDRGEIEAAEKRRLPKIIEISDIRGDLHVHTRASDGRDTIRDMALAAKKRGYAYLAITDHTKHARIAHGLTVKRLEKQIDEIDRLNEELSGVRILKSSEVDILADGSLDLPDATLAKLDLAVCAVHFDFDLSPAKQTERIIRAMDHPAFSILAHPTCRLIGERDPMRVNMERLMDAALERGCFLEVNGQPERLDLNDIHCRMAKERGLKLALSTDAHTIEQLGLMRFSIGQARRGWLERSDVINALNWRELKTLLKRCG